jgi:hypothetical protein
MADRPSVPAANDRPGDRRTVADVQVEIGQRSPLVLDRDEIRDVEHRCTARLDAVADSGGQERVLDSERLKAEGAQRERLAGVDRLSLVEWVPPDRLPRLLGRVDGARSPVAEAARMIGVRVRHDDRLRPQGRKPPAPVEPAVDHDRPSAIRHEKRAVPPMPARPRVDLAPRSEEGKLHRTTE